MHLLSLNLFRGVTLGPQTINLLFQVTELATWFTRGPNLPKSQISIDAPTWHLHGNRVTLYLPTRHS